MIKEIKELSFLTTRQLNALEKKNIRTIKDFLEIKPTQYCIPMNVKNINEGDWVAVCGVVKKVYYNKNNVTCMIDIPQERESMVMTWFGWVGDYAQLLKEGRTCTFCGKVVFNSYNNCLQIINPVVEAGEYRKIKPIYKKIKGITNELYMRILQTILSEACFEEVYSERIREKFQLPTCQKAYYGIFKPDTMDDIKQGEKYLLFDDLFTLAISLRKWSIGESKNEIRCDKMSSVPVLLRELPFNLTDGPNSQLETVRCIVKKINKGLKTNSLIHGDVGCGKTLVAIILMLIMAENGYQSVLMAPTNVLARQHYAEIVKTLHSFDFAIPVLLTGDMKASEKKKVLEKIKNGDANIVVGTHAVLSDSVIFNNIGLNIVDEEHRFGVKQREAITDKYKNIHTVIMSATPIPRTMGVVLYGSETDFYTIKKMPAGRKPVDTNIVTDIKAGYEAIYNEIKKGHQAYVICPLIEESTSDKMNDVTSIEEAFKNLTEYFAFDKSVKIGMISGRLSEAALEDEINKFANNEYQILVSTTVVEVGVNVPNATVILVENAERFGLAQLHQLRGRVGRSNLQSYCLLNTPKTDVARLDVMTKTTDGFIIAKEDVKLRGIGDLAGTKQCGVYENVAKMIANEALYQKITEEIETMIQYIREYDKIKNAIQSI